MLNKGIDLNQENTLACRTGPVSFFTGTGGGGIFSRSSSSLPHIRPTHTHTTLTKFQLISNASYHVWEDLPQLMLTRAQNQNTKKNTFFFSFFTSSLQPRSSDFVAYPLQVVRPPRWAAHFSSRRAHTPWVWQSVFGRQKLVFQAPFFQGLCSTLGGVFSRKLNLPPLKMDGLEDLLFFLF